MRIVSAINYKGGVGKTTLAANIAAALASSDWRVLMVDLDPQTNLTFSFVKPEYWESELAEKKTIKAAFDALLEGEKKFDLESLVITPEAVRKELKGKGRLDLIASHLGLINVDLELAKLLAGHNVKAAQKNFVSVHHFLRARLEALAVDKYDIVIIDCPPNFNIVTKTAIVASDAILVPTRADYLSSIGIEYLRINIEKLVESYNSYIDALDLSKKKLEMPWVGIAFNMIQIFNGAPIMDQQKYVNKVKKIDGCIVFNSMIKNSATLFANAPVVGVPAVLKKATGPVFPGIIDSLFALATEFAHAIGAGGDA